ncbi:MAG: replicative DNA helicase [Akkermansiaceae bacterium]|nr:replicative DNA helicase [Akkermansiaceae bacterium]NNM29640.1 replicative DNA helicase [Akkermansiaceae bacterium]
MTPEGPEQQDPAGKGAAPRLQVVRPEDGGPARALPNATGPEKSILSSMMQDATEYVGHAVEQHLSPEHFYLPSHQTLYKVLLELYEKDQPVELVSLTQILRDRGILENIGGPSELTSTYAYSPTAAHFDHHLGIVKSKHLLRSVISSCTEAIANAYEDPEDVSQFLDGVEQTVFAIKESSEVQGEISARDLIGDVLDIIEQFAAGERGMQGLSTGYPDLDEMANGLKSGEMFVVAARPSMGKTSYMMNIVEHIAVTHSEPTLVFSCEMSAQQIIQRLLFARARFPLSNLKPGFQLTRSELERIKGAAQELMEAPLFIDDTPAISIGDVRAKARRKKRDEDIKLIAIDYLQLMRSKSRQADNSREREIAEISAGLKALAKELKIPIIVLAQLNRGPEQRGGVPRLSDLRESGSIEQDADLVGLLYREEYYADNDEERDEAQGKSQLVIAKNRNGPTGDVPLTFIKELMRFESRAPQGD